MSCVELNENVVIGSIFIVNVYLNVDDDVKTLEGFSRSEAPRRRAWWGCLVGGSASYRRRGSGKVRRFKVPLGLATAPSYKHCASTVHLVLLALYSLPLPWLFKPGPWPMMARRMCGLRVPVQ